MSKLSYIKRRYVEHEVNGEKLKFYEVLPSTFIELEDLFISIAQSQMVLARSLAQLCGSSNDIEEEKFSEERSTSRVSQVVIAPDIGVIQHHDMTQETAVVQLINAMKGNLDQIYTFVTQSLKLSEEEAREFQNEAGANTLAQCVEGAFKANDKVFSPFRQAASQTEAPQTPTSPSPEGSSSKAKAPLRLSEIPSETPNEASAPSGPPSRTSSVPGISKQS